MSASKKKSFSIFECLSFSELSVIKKKFNWNFLFSTAVCTQMTFSRENRVEKSMAPHSSTLAWKIPWTEEPGRLQSTGSLRVGQHWATSFSFHFHALEKEMATQSSVLAWRIPGMGEPGGLPSMGSHRVGHDWSDLAAAAAEKIGREIQWDYGEKVHQLYW